MTFVSAIDQISAPWLAEALEQAGFGRTSVRDFSVERVGTGQAAVSCRIRLEYADGGADLPQTIIAKFPSEDPASARGGAEQGTYMREVRFYAELRQHLTIRTPRCYLARIEGSGPAFVLLLEDLAPAEQGDQIAGCGAQLARAGVMQLVGLHAPSWENRSLLDHDWISYPTLPGRGERIARLYRGGLPHFMERCAHALPAEEIALLERLARADDFPSEHPVLQARCLTHNDYRLDNFLIDANRPADEMHVVDWQTYGLGNPMRDLSYFLGGCLEPDLRGALEEELLRDYLDRMRAAGVTDYDRDQCWTDYRLASFHGIMMAMAAMTFVARTERGDLLFTTMVHRHARQALETGADAFLP